MKEEPKEEKKEQKKEERKIEQEEEEEEKEHQETLSKNECMDLINSDDNMDGLFGITEYKDNKIRFHIFDDSQRFNLIENDSDHNIELIEEDNNVIIKASRIENGTVKKDISYPATKELMIAITKDVGDKFDKKSLNQFKKIYEICLKPKCDKHIFRIGKGRPSKDHYRFLEAIDERMTNSRKFKYLEKVIKGLGYNDIALQPIHILRDASDQFKRIFVLLGLLRCGNANPDILSEFSALLDQLYKDNKINKLLYKSLYYKGKNALDKNRAKSSDKL